MILKCFTISLISVSNCFSYSTVGWSVSPVIYLSIEKHKLDVEVAVIPMKHANNIQARSMMYDVDWFLL